MAEDSRAIAVKRQEDDALAAERQQSAEREALAESGTNGRAIRNGSGPPATQKQARIRAQSESERLIREKDAQRAAFALVGSG